MRIAPLAMSVGLACFSVGLSGQTPPATVKILEPKPEAILHRGESFSALVQVDGVRPDQIELVWLLTDMLTNGGAGADESQWMKIRPHDTFTSNTVAINGIIPKTVRYGSYSVTAMVAAKDAAGNPVRGPDGVESLFSKSVTIRVEPRELAKPLVVEPAQIKLDYLGDISFHDIAIRDANGEEVSRSSLLHVRSANPGIAKVLHPFDDGYYSVQAVGVGTTTIWFEDAPMKVTVFNARRGDFDADGFVNAADVASLRREIDVPNKGRPAKQPVDAFDLNGDGTVDEADLAVLRGLCDFHECKSGPTMTAHPLTNAETYRPGDTVAFQVVMEDIDLAQVRAIDLNRWPWIQGAEPEPIKAGRVTEVKNSWADVVVAIPKDAVPGLMGITADVEILNRDGGFIGSVPTGVTVRIELPSLVVPLQLPVKRIRLSYVPEEFALHWVRDANGTPLNSSELLSWRVDNPDIVELFAPGYVRARQRGKTTLWVNDIAIPVEVVGGKPGDLNGDGMVDWLDVQLLTVVTTNYPFVVTRPVRSLGPLLQLGGDFFGDALTFTWFFSALEPVDERDFNHDGTLDFQDVVELWNRCDEEDCGVGEVMRRQNGGKGTVKP